MNRSFFALALLLGVMAVIWVGVGFVGSNALALLMTAIIAAVYGFGALELLEFRRATATLAAALAAIPEDLPKLVAWLDRLHPSLQNPVRLRIEGERSALPGPALTPYLVGLLVMLGMLGTFLGMVVTLNGAVFALEGTTDVQAIRSALAAPIKGLGLAFGTSVAGVAASAMLGLMSALSRRERMLTAQLLDSRIATVLRGFSLAHQRQETVRALQSQAQALPVVVDRLQAMIEQIERREQQLSARLLGNQERFHGEVRDAYTDLAGAVGKSLKESLAEGARVAGENIKLVAEAVLTGIAREAKLLHKKMIDSTGAQMLSQQQRICSTLDKTAREISEHAQANASRTLDETARLMAAVSEAPRAAAEMIGQLRQEMSNSLARDHRMLEERGQIMETLNSLLAAIHQSSGEQRATIEALVDASTVLLGNAGSQFVDQLGAESARLSGIAAQVSSSAVEVSSLSEAFAFAVQLFSEANEKLIASLQRIEASMDRSTARSDEQLAYYVAQAREIIDLSILSHKEVVEELLQPAGKPATTANQVI